MQLLCQFAFLFRKVYGADPLECPKRRSVKSGPMRVIALLEDPAAIRRILEHLGRWASECRRNILSEQCSVALNQRQTVAIGQTREKSRIEFPIVGFEV